jgi:ectoine hydroxylase-related dioxygenase (phytanoyl-CoA dioxygenase family)
MEVVRLTEEQGRRFEETGYLVVEEALPAGMAEELRQRSLGLYEADRQARGFGRHDFWELRNCLLADEAFLPLVDWPATFPLVVDLLGPNIQLSTSHLTVLPPAAPGATANAGGWHRDGGTSASEMAEPHPRLFIKIAYWLSDTRDPRSGAMRLVPGSNRLTGRPPTLPGEDGPVGAIDLRVRPGTAVLFEQRTWHCRGHNQSPEPRVGLFIGYSYRWIRPMDYVTMPEELLARCSPIRRQLLGDAQTQMGYYLPTDADIPLRAWAKERAV